MEENEMTTESIFAKYWREVADILGIEGKATKRFAIRLSSDPMDSIVGNGLQVVQRLYNALSNPNWVSENGSNWAWRSTTPEFNPGNKSREVVLERMIVKTGSSTDWTCQMSTSSGVQPRTRLNKRRAIDLVRRNAPDHYSFVELKVDSDNPLHAAFEILSYALAYLNARNNRQKGSGHHDIMAAKHIALIVLGPEAWYRDYKSEEQGFKWLADNLKSGLNAMSGEKPEFDFSFQKYRYVDGDDLNETASGILGLAKTWK